MITQGQEDMRSNITNWHSITLFPSYGQQTVFRKEEGNPPVPSQRPVTGIFFDLKRLSIKSRRRWSETPIRSLWRRCNDKTWLTSALVGDCCLGAQWFHMVSQNLVNISSDNDSPHDDVIKWKHYPRYWPFVREFHRSPVNFPHKGQWRGALMLSLICARMNSWVNNREAGDLGRYRVHYVVIVMPVSVAMPWPKPQLTCCQLDPQEQISITLE